MSYLLVMAYTGNSPGDLDCPSDSNRKTGLQGWGPSPFQVHLGLDLPLMVLINLLWTNILKNALYFSVNVFSTLVVRY